MTKLALPVWENRISPVFDSCQQVRIMSMSGRTIDDHKDFWFGNRSVESRVSWLLEASIDVLLCGAITRQVEELLLRRGVVVVSFVAGDVDEVLNAFLAGDFPSHAFAMPGCCARHRHGCRRWNPDSTREGFGRTQWNGELSVSADAPKRQSRRRHRS